MCGNNWDDGDVAINPHQRRKDSQNLIGCVSKKPANTLGVIAYGTDSAPSTKYDITRNSRGASSGE
jgi:hypothetical protein